MLLEVSCFSISHCEKNSAHIVSRILDKKEMAAEFLVLYVSPTIWVLKMQITAELLKECEQNFASLNILVTYILIRFCLIQFSINFLFCRKKMFQNVCISEQEEEKKKYWRCLSISCSCGKRRPKTLFALASEHTHTGIFQIIYFHYDLLLNILPKWSEWG